MENLNAEQIKKALECCSPSGKHCTECVYFYRAVDDICAPYLMADALALINQLTEENEKLLTALANYNRLTDVRIAEEYYTAEAYEELREENERLREIISSVAGFDTSLLCAWCREEQTKKIAKEMEGVCDT